MRWWTKPPGEPFADSESSSDVFPQLYYGHITRRNSHKNPIDEKEFIILPLKMIYDVTDKILY